MANAFCHVELHSNDLGRAKEFFGELFNWKLDEMPMGPDAYTMIGVGEGTGGGMMKNPVTGTPSHWVAYVLVDDLDATTSKAESLGGTVLQPKTEVPNFGAFSIHSGSQWRGPRFVGTEAKIDAKVRAVACTCCHHQRFKRWHTTKC